MSSYSVTLTGDAIMNTRVSCCEDKRVLQLVEILRSSDVTQTQVEIPLHDFVGHDIFPSAEGALSWMSAPTITALELRWCGIDIVSVASNHAFDYSYGGLRSTLAALDDARIPHAGAGSDLAEARTPAFLDTSRGRIGMVSAVSSFPAFARAGAARADVRGRPGVNGLRFHHVVDPTTADQLCDLYSHLGYWITSVGHEMAINPPGLHNTLLRFRVDDRLDGVTTQCDEDDLSGTIAAIRYARAVSDFVIAHLHSHEWEAADGRMCSTPAFVVEFAKAAIEAGASVVIVQGSHAPFRGIAVHDDVPIFYDPGPLFRLGRRDKQPQDFYMRWGNGPEARSANAGILEAFAARDLALGGDAQETHHVRSPLEGVSHQPGFLVPVCRVDAHDHSVTSVTLYPATWIYDNKGTTGFPILATGDTAKAVLDRAVELSALYGTTISVKGDTASVDLRGKVDRLK